MRAMSPSTVRRYWLSIAVWNDTIVVCGGRSVNTGGSHESSCEQFTASSGDTGDGTWSFLPALLPIAVDNAGMAVVAGKLYVIGGYSDAFHCGVLASRISVVDLTSNRCSDVRCDRCATA